jgi:hypothetical protein
VSRRSSVERGREALAVALYELPRWAELTKVAQRSGAYTRDDAERAGAAALAAERRERFPLLRSWGPDDPQPRPEPAHGVYDVRGIVWLHRGGGVWEMSRRDQRR